MSDVRRELELASRVVAMCRVAAERGTRSIPFERVWNDIKSEPLGVVYSQAKMLIDSDRTLDNAERVNVYRSLGHFFQGILRYAKGKGVVLKVRNGS